MTTLDGPRERSSVKTSPPQERIIGLTGIVGTVLLFAALSTGTPGEPQVNASTADAARYVADLPGWVAPVEAVGDIAMMVLLWAMVGLALLLRRYEGATPVRSPWRCCRARWSRGSSSSTPARRRAPTGCRPRPGTAGVRLRPDVHRLHQRLVGDGELRPRLWLGHGHHQGHAALARLVGRVGGIAVSLAQFVWKNEVAWVVLYIPLLAVAGDDLGAAGSRPLESAPADTGERTGR